MAFYYEPPAGWKIVEQATITSANQYTYRVGPLDNCGLKSVAKMVAGTDAEADYAPPIGWHVAYLQRDAGQSFDQLYDTDTVWIDTNGTVYSINQCTNIGTAMYSTDGDGTQPEPKKASSLWLIAAGAALLLFTLTD